MGYVLKAVLSSAQHPEYGQISGEIAPAWLEHLNQLIDRLDSEQEA